MIRDVIGLWIAADEMSADLRHVSALRIARRVTDNSVLRDRLRQVPLTGHFFTPAASITLENGGSVYVVCEGARSMRGEVARWRPRLFHYALAMLAIDIATYLGALAFIRTLGSAGVEIRAGAWFFLFGSAFSLLAFFLSIFGSGWKRVGLAAACLVTLPFWYGFTLY